jgi:S1-C subfamily serine protease
MKVETITEHMLFSTVRLEAEIPAGTSTGTGFIFSDRSADTDHLFIVTNKHVIDNSSAVRFLFTQGTGTSASSREKRRVALASDSSRIQTCTTAVARFS